MSDHHLKMRHHYLSCSQIHFNILNCKEKGIVKRMVSKPYVWNLIKLNTIEKAQSKKNGNLCTVKVKISQHARFEAQKKRKRGQKYERNLY